jgi:hypothetical protein
MLYMSGDAEATIRRADRFFMKTDPVHQTLFNLARRLDQEKIDYALIGGMALNLHGYERMTVDVDLLLTKDGLEKFHSALAGLGYVPAFTGAKKHFRDTASSVKIEIITAGEYPGDGLPKEVVFPDPALVSEDIDGIKVVRLETLVELKLASGLSAPHRIRDLADVQQLIEVLNLPRDLASRLKPSVRDEYARLWSATQEAANKGPGLE